MSQRWENCVAYVDDGKSGETLERAALKQMLESLRQGEVKRIVMTSLDRLTRKLAHLVKLLDEQAIVVRNFFKLASDGATPNELATLANLQG